MAVAPVVEIPESARERRRVAGLAHLTERYAAMRTLVGRRSVNAIYVPERGVWQSWVGASFERAAPHERGEWMTLQGSLRKLYNAIKRARTDAPEETREEWRRGDVGWRGMAPW